MSSGGFYSGFGGGFSDGGVISSGTAIPAAGAVSGLGATAGTSLATAIGSIGTFGTGGASAGYYPMQTAGSGTYAGISRILETLLK